MTISDFFKQVKGILGRWNEQKHKRHIAFAQRIDGRIGTYVITELGVDCPQQIVDAFQVYHSAVGVEDGLYKQATSSELTDEIEQADTTRDNTWSGVMNYLDFMRRLGTDEQKAAAKRLIGAAEFYGIKNNSKYEDQNVDTMQWIQQCEGALAADVTALNAGSYVAKLKTETQAVIDLIGQRNAELSQIDTKAMVSARQATEDAYVKLIGILNAHAITESVQGASPYDLVIDYINRDIVYYVDKVFTKDKKKGDSSKPTSTTNSDNGGSGSGSDNGSGSGSGSSEGGSNEGGSEGGSSEGGSEGGGSGEGGSQGGGTGTITPGGGGSEGGDNGGSGGEGGDGGDDDPYGGSDMN